MSEWKAAMTSYTEASRGRRVLQQHGYSAEIRRLEHLDSDGCGFTLVVRGDCRRVSDILTNAGIAYRELQEGRGIR